MYLADDRKGYREMEETTPIRFSFILMRCLFIDLFNDRAVSDVGIQHRAHEPKCKNGSTNFSFTIFIISYELNMEDALKEITNP